MPWESSHYNPLLLLFAALLICGCTGGGPLSTPTKSVSPIQHGLSLAVWLEDRCEDAETDERTVTLLEALHDGLILPAETLFAIVAVAVAGSAWSLYDRIALPAGSPLPNRPEVILRHVAPQRAGPAVRTTSVAWLGCLRGYDDVVDCHAIIRTISALASL